MQDLVSVFIPSCKITDEFPTYRRMYGLERQKKGRTRHTTSFRKLVLIILFHFHFSSGFSGKRKIGASGVVFVSVFFKFLLFRFDRDVVRIDYDYFTFAFFGFVFLLFPAAGSET